jgi:hypothetical protein
MEWHLGLVALTFLGIFAPSSLVLVGLGLAYTIWYCVDSAMHARLDDLERWHGPSTWARRLRWRTMLAWLHFLEPIARDWGRLRGGLTPWRSARPGRQSVPSISPWWQRMQPLRRAGSWSYPGTMKLERYALLKRLTDKLNTRNCAVGWNSDWQDWDLRVRRGALGEARLRLAVEHHGGPQRVAKIAVSIRQPASFYWVQATLAVAAVVAAALGLWVAPIALAALLALVWIAPTAEANRLESALRSVADEVAAEMDPHLSDDVVGGQEAATG